jgi:hypothetical protein
MSAAVKSVEDHGYILDLGLSDVTGFLSFRDAQKGHADKMATLHVGQLVDVSVTKLSRNDRTCNVTIDTVTFSSSSVSSLLFHTLCLIYVLSYLSSYPKLRTRPRYFRERSCSLSLLLFIPQVSIYKSWAFLKAPSISFISRMISLKSPIKSERS